MSIVDENGKPVAYGWNDIAGQELLEKNRALREISDAEFEQMFPELFSSAVTIAHSAVGEKRNVVPKEGIHPPPQAS